MDHRKIVSLECFNRCDSFGAGHAINLEKLHGGTGMLVEKFLHNTDILRSVYTTTTDRSMDDSHLNPLSIGDLIQT